MTDTFMVEFGQRLAKLEERSEAQEKQLTNLDQNVEQILLKLSSISGGKKAMVAVFAVLGTLLTSAITIAIGIWNHAQRMPSH